MVGRLRSVLGEDGVLTEANAASPFTVGARIGGGGSVVAVARPRTLRQAVEALQACADAGVAVIPQGANSGLTGGSVPRSDRKAVVMSMRRLDRVTVLGAGDRVVCLAGAGLLDVDEALRGVDREGHSKLGSTFLNPSVAGGVSFGSGEQAIKVASFPHVKA